MAHSSGTHPALTVMALWMLQDALFSSSSLSLYVTLSLVEPAEGCVSVLHS